MREGAQSVSHGREEETDPFRGDTDLTSDSLGFEGRIDIRMTASVKPRHFERNFAAFLVGLCRVIPLVEFVDLVVGRT
jgi:hypothetical protein